MSSEQWIALLAVVVAAVALGATTVLALALRRIRADVRGLADASHGNEQDRTARAGRDAETDRSSYTPGVAPTATDGHAPSRELDVVATTPLPGARPDADGDQIVTREGRVVVVPSTRQVVDATLGKPMIRGAVLSHGLRYALRPESRDRLRGMVRRELRRRRRIRLRAGRRAARTADIPPRDAQAWLSKSATRRLNVEDDGGS